MFLQAGDGCHLLHLAISVVDNFIQRIIIFAIEEAFQRWVPFDSILITLLDVWPTKLDTVLACAIHDVKHFVGHDFVRASGDFVAVDRGGVRGRMWHAA